MELWFLFSLISTVFAGIHVFIQKVGVARHYNSNLLNSYSAAVSAVIGIAVGTIYEGVAELSLIMIGIGVLSGIVYIYSTNIRMDALKYMDATIFLPLHKFISPLIAMLFGVFWFSERMNSHEWLGIVLGLLTPLLLITHDENHRQLNLKKGLVLMVLSATFAALAAVINKVGADMFTSMLLFAGITNGFSALTGSAIYQYRSHKAHENIVRSELLDPGLIILSIISGVAGAFCFGAFMLALGFGGSLSIVYTVQSLYILIPIVLAIIVYGEHWNTRKVIAIVLSISALWLMR